MVAAYFNAVQRRMRVILNLTSTTARAHGHVTWMSLCGATLPITMVRRQCVLQCVAVCCSVLQQGHMDKSFGCHSLGRLFQLPWYVDSVCCSVLQRGVARARGQVTWLSLFGAILPTTMVRR